MIYQILRSFLGPFTIILDYLATRTEWVTAVFCLYLAMFGAGKYQYKQIKKRLFRILQESCKPWLIDHPTANEGEFRVYLASLLDIELKKCHYLYVLNDHDLWPVSVTADHVLRKLEFSVDSLRKDIAEDKPFVLKDRKPEIVRRKEEKGNKEANENR